MINQPEQLVEEIRVKEERCSSPVQSRPKRSTKLFRTPLVKAALILKWDSESVQFMRPEDRQARLEKHGCPWNTFRKWLKYRNKWISRAKKADTKRARQIHNNQKKGLFAKEQKELVRKITAKRARGLPVTGYGVGSPCGR